MHRKSMVLTAAVMLLAAQLGAGPRLVTLEEALDSARSANLSIEYARAELAREMRIQDNVMSTFMPELSLRASAGPSVSFPSSSSSEIRYGGLDVSASANASFAFRGEMINDGTVRSLAREAASLSFRSSCQDIESDIITAYWNMAALAAEKSSADAALNLAEEQYRSVSEGYESGTVPELEMRNTEYSLSVAQLTADIAEDALLIAMEELKSLTGIDEDFATLPIPDPVMLSLPSAEEVFLEHADGSLSMQQARNTLESEKADKAKNTYSAYVPTLTASIGYSYGGAADGSWNYTHSTNRLSGSISVNIPISTMLPGGTADSAIKESGDRVKLAEIALSQTQKTLLQDIRTRVMRIGQLQSQILSSRHSEELARRTYELTAEAFEAGAASALDLSDARTSLLSSQMSTISSEADHLLECYALSYLLNIDLTRLQDEYAAPKEVL